LAGCPSGENVGELPCTLGQSQNAPISHRAKRYMPGHRPGEVVPPIAGTRCPFSLSQGGAPDRRRNRHFVRTRARVSPSPGYLVAEVTVEDGACEATERLGGLAPHCDQPVEKITNGNQTQLKAESA
jgi:hypothetical protein